MDSESQMLPQAYLLHHIPGRMRINLPALKGDGWLLQEIRESLSPLPGVRDIETNSLTGSVLLRYAADEFENFGARLAEQAERDGLFTLNLPPRNSGRRLSMRSAEPVNVTGASEMARAITGIMGEVNTGIKRQTDNIIDLKFLLPFGMAMYGAFKADKRAGTPLWLTMILFSFTSFVMLNQEETSNKIREPENDVDHCQSSLKEQTKVTSAS
jgi:hypothetical protein